MVEPMNFNGTPQPPTTFEFPMVEIQPTSNAQTETTPTVLYSESSSESGLGKFGTGYVEKMLKEYGSKAWHQYQQAIDRLRQGPALVNQQRILQNQQWNRDIQVPMYNAMRTGINSLAGRGMVGSSVSGDWMARIAQQAQESGRKQQADSNVWASGQEYQNLRDMIAATGGMTGTIKDFLDSTRFSKSSQSTPITVHG